MAEEKVVDRNGVKQLYKKARMGLLTEAELEDRLEYINYVSDESVANQSFNKTYTYKSGMGKVVDTISDNGFVYGKAKSITITIDSTIEYSSGIADITFELRLPAGGAWFVNGEIKSGGSPLVSFVEKDVSGRRKINKTYTFYIAKVK